MLRAFAVACLFSLSACAVGVGTSSGSDAGAANGADAASCDGWAGPDTPAGCHACGSTTSTCQSNGCYGGYWCETSTAKCHASAPSGC